MTPDEIATRSDLDILASTISERLDRLEQLLTAPATKTMADVPLDVAQAAAYLGISPKTVYKLVHLRTLPSFKQGKFLRFRVSDLEAYAFSHRRASQSEIDARAARHALPRG